MEKVEEFNYKNHTTLPKPHKKNQLKIIKKFIYALWKECITLNLTIYLSISTMNKKTFKRRLQSLSSELYQHAHKKELLNIMLQQLADDTSVIEPEVINVV